MAKLEILQKGNRLFHAYVAVHFEAHISDRISWIYIPDDIFCNHIQCRHLFAREMIVEIRMLEIILCNVHNDVRTCLKTVKIHLICCSSDDSNWKSEK